MALLQENVYYNDDLEKLKAVVATIPFQQLFSLELALGLDNQPWFFDALKQSGLFKIFEIFNVTNPLVVQAFIEYSNNPSVNEFDKMMSLIFGVDGYNFTSGKGVVNLNISADFFTQPRVVVDESDAKEARVCSIDGVTTEPRVFVYPNDYILAEQDLYILEHFVPAGVKLEINLI